MFKETIQKNMVGSKTREQVKKHSFFGGITYDRFLANCNLPKEDVYAILEVIPKSDKPIFQVKGEQNTLSEISGGNTKVIESKESSDHAKVTTGAPMTPEGGMIYNLEKKDGKWEIVSSSGWMS